MTKALIVDCLGRGLGKRLSTVDVIGAGPRVVAGILERNKVYTRLTTYENFVKTKVFVKNFDMLLISAMSTDIGAVEKAIAFWRKHEEKRKPIIIGGPLVFGIDKIKHLDFDIAVYGEGEETLNELLTTGLKDGELPSSDVMRKIKGIVIKNKSGEIFFTGKRKFLSRTLLDKYMPSTRIVKDYPIYWASRIYVEILRGCSNFYRPLIVLPRNAKCCNLCFEGPLEFRTECPYNIPPGCGYCSVPALYGPSRSRSIGTIFEEIKGLINVGVTRITLSASNILDYGRDWLVEPKPLTDPKNPPPNIVALRKLFNEIFNIPEVSSGEVTVLLENIRASLLNEEVAKLLAEYFKGTPVHIGCETGSEVHAKLLGRADTPKDVIRAVKILVKYGLKPYVYFIHGLPGQNEKTVLETVNVMKELDKLGVEKITTYRFTPLPGTSFEKFPSGKPITKDRLSKAIVDKANRINMKRKREFKGKKIEAIVVGQYHKNKRFNVAYPIPHGPVILLENANKYYGFKVKVEIVDVISERLVKGKILQIIKRVRSL